MGIRLMSRETRERLKASKTIMRFEWNVLSSLHDHGTTAENILDALERYARARVVRCVCVWDPSKAPKVRVDLLNENGTVVAYIDCISKCLRRPDTALRGLKDEEIIPQCMPGSPEYLVVSEMAIIVYDVIRTQISS